MELCISVKDKDAVLTNVPYKPVKEIVFQHRRSEHVRAQKPTEVRMTKAKCSMPQKKGLTFQIL